MNPTFRDRTEAGQRLARELRPYAVPTAAAATCAELRPPVDALVTLMEPENFHAVGEWYDDFSQTTDAEVTQLLQQAKETADHAPD